MLPVHVKQLSSCRDGQLLNHAAPGQVQASHRQLTSIIYKWPFFRQYLTNERKRNVFLRKYVSDQFHYEVGFEGDDNFFGMLAR